MRAYGTKRRPTRRGLAEAMLDLEPMALFVPDAAQGIVQELTGRYTATLQNGASVIAGEALGPDLAGAVSLDGVNDYVSTDFGTRRNYLPSPSGEGSAGVTANGVATVTAQSDEQTIYGQRTTKVVTPGTNAHDGVLLCLGGAAGAVTTVPGDIWATRAIARCPSLPVGGMRYTFGINVYGAAGYAGALSSGTQVVTAQEGDTELVFPGVTMPATVGGQVPTRVQPYVVVQTPAGAPVAATYYVGARALEKVATVGAQPGRYFDGTGYVNAQGVWVPSAGDECGWLNTAHASASDKGCLANGTERTFIALVKPSSTGATAYIAGSSISSALGLSMTSDRRVMFALNTAVEVEQSTETPFVAGTPVLVATEIDEPGDTGKFFADGEELTYANAPSSQQFGAGATLEIGRRGNATGYFPGLIGPLAIYSRALTTDG